MGIIKSTKGVLVKVDDADFEWLVQYKWSIISSGYAMANINGKPTLMHRLINNTPQGFDTDHINMDKLDNRRVNLRVATRRQNMLNTGPSKSNKLGVKGVSFDKWTRDSKKYRTYVRGKYIGRFKTLHDAALAYKMAIKELPWV